MSKREKLFERLLSKPNDFTWDELISVLKSLEYREIYFGKTGGSRVRFIHPTLPPIFLHKPHPNKILKRYQLDQIIEFLRFEELI